MSAARNVPALKMATMENEQKIIDDFIFENAYEDPLLQDFLFHKLYNQLGEKDHDLWAILEATLDFSEKKNCCIAMKIGEFLVCREPCEGGYCHKHLLQIKEMRMLPRPCKVCGVGVTNTYCSSCILETGEREQNIRLAKEFEEDEPSIGSFGWHLKNQGVTGTCKQQLHV